MIHVYNSKKIVFISFLMIIVQFLSAQPQIELELVASGFEEPVDIANAGDERLFIVERNGKIKILHEGGTITEFLILTHV